MSNFFDQISGFFQGFKLPKISFINIGDGFTRTTYGKLQAGDSGVYSVRFPIVYSEVPVVFAFPNMRTGTVAKETFTPPKLPAIKEVVPPTIPKVVPSTKPSVSQAQAPTLGEVRITGDTRGIPFNDIFGRIRTTLNNIIDNLYNTETGLIKRINTAFGAMAEQSTEKMQGVADQVNVIIPNTTKALTDRINKVITDTNSGLNTVSAQATDALNSSVAKLYQLLNLDEGIKFTPLGLEEVTTTSFKLFIPKDATVLWVAVGKVKVI